jgi:hypothetical protein
MLVATCHCGAVEVGVARKPRRLTSCNCSICRRYGTLWAYYKPSEVRIAGTRSARTGYSWGDKELDFVRCRTCGCVMYWKRIRGKRAGRMGVNARNFDPRAIESVRIRRLDGASTWKFLD